ncbi:MAG: metabolite traffic protein EboE [Deltaproteobacteria bacterium]|nr:metabolite traffic protein EboE [Deltaproteobacteria bacterium]
MKIPGYPDTLLCYCQNVHPAETWDEAFSAISTHALAVRERVSPFSPFGLGLRLSKKAADTLIRPGNLAAFRDFLRSRDCYVFTINGFPYGNFHATPVKERVYAPDWRDADRLSYTLSLAEILAGLLPDGISGSVSTVPGSWKPWLKGPGDVEEIRANLGRAALGLAEIFERTGRTVNLALEPEPGCLLETTRETIDFFDTLPDEARGRIGVCLDACHAATVFEEPSESLAALLKNGVPVFKVQVSAALSAELPEGLAALKKFADPVYLHQTRIIGEDGCIRAWDDLPEALDAYNGGKGTCRVHFHVPLHTPPMPGFSSTAEGLSPLFFALALQGGVSHFEIETYTFDVLPPELKACGVVTSIAKEYGWVLSRLPGA